jgi:ribosome biogenesis GTPase
VKGRVVESTGSWYLVDTEAFSEPVKCKLKGHFKIKGIKSTNPIAVGDQVQFEMDRNNEVGLIYTIEERKNYIIRRSVNLSKRTHILASNLDQAVLVATLAQPRTSTGFMDRFLVTAEAYHIPALIVFNKTDLYDDDQLAQLCEMKALYEKCGYRCCDVSALKKLGIAQLTDQLKNKVSLLAGHSGVGKSALVNAMDLGKNIKTGEISEVHAKGTHTTTFAKMHSLSFGGFIIDIPGIKEFGLFDFDKTDLGHYFPEIRDYMDHCKFNNCSHEHEPHCAVIEAVELGHIAPSRYQNYLNMLHGEDMNEVDYSE